MLSKKLRIISSIIVAVVLISSLSGCGGGVASILKVSVARAILGEKWTDQNPIVTILADVIGSGVKKVIARIAKIGSSDTSPVVLTLNDQGKYEGDYKPDTSTDPANSTQYSVVVTATDNSGNVASSIPTTFEVPPVDNTTGK